MMRRESPHIAAPARAHTRPPGVPHLTLSYPAPQLLPCMPPIYRVLRDTCLHILHIHPHLCPHFPTSTYYAEYPVMLKA